MKITAVSLIMKKEEVYSIPMLEGRISSPGVAVNVIRETYGLHEKPKEHFVIMMLDTKYRPINLVTISIGTLNSSLVHPREVFQPIILSNSAAFIAFHNHPSGVVEPSSEDIKVTSRLLECSKVLGIELIDHIIIGESEFYSLKENGYFY